MKKLIESIKFRNETAGYPDWILTEPRAHTDAYVLFMDWVREEIYDQLIFDKFLTKNRMYDLLVSYVIKRDAIGYDLPVLADVEEELLLDANDLMIAAQEYELYETLGNFKLYLEVMNEVKYKCDII